jgi:hypothetical protein
MTKTRLALSFFVGVAATSGAFTGARPARAGDQWIEACADLSSCEGATFRHVQIWAGGLTSHGEVLFGPWNSVTGKWDGHRFEDANQWGEIGAYDDAGNDHPISFDVGQLNCNKMLAFRVCDQTLATQARFDCLHWNGQPTPAVSDTPSYTWVPCP